MENNNEKVIWEALKENVEPPAEAKVYLSEFFDSFSLELQKELVGRGYVNKQKCEVWSRVMGYFRPVDQFNAGKKQEFAQRTRLYIK